MCHHAACDGPEQTDRPLGNCDRQQQKNLIFRKWELILPSVSQNCFKWS